MVFFVRSDDGMSTTVLNAERPNVHAFAADAYATITKDAARAIEVNDGRPLLLFLVQLAFHEPGFGGTVGEGHVLQFAFAASIADGAIQRMIAEQELDGSLARLLDLVTLAGDDHAISDGNRARGLQLRHLLDADDAHAAGGLQ